MKPYYDHAGITIYHGDCRTALASVGAVDAVVTDPPYPSIEKDFQITPIDILDVLNCLQFVFWSAVDSFPLSWTAVHIWHKPNGQSAHHYERIFERNGGKTFRVYRVSAILPNYDQYREEKVAHETQKPLKLIRPLIEKTSGVVIDPFMGSGTTLRAAKDLGRRAIGIEIDERYREIAAKRLGQEVFDFSGAQS